MDKKEKYLEFNNHELAKLHQDLLLPLLEVDRICKKHNIRYFLSDGTLLGAVRHKGFIPWDDDIDVHMLRNDYDEFCKVCRKELNKSEFFLQTQETDKYYNWVYGKLRLKKSSYVRTGQEHLKQKNGIFIDILPIDNMIGNNLIQLVFNFICKICRRILWAPVGKVSEKNMFSRWKYTIISLIPRKFTIYIFNFFTKFYNDKQTDFLVYNNTELESKKLLVFKKEWYDKVINMEFEGYEFSAPIGYDEILNLTYGDYMVMPPKSERRGHCYASYVKFTDGTELKLI